MEHSDLTALGKKYSGYIELDPDEEFVCEIKKHPFGYLLVWLVGLFIAVSILAVTIATIYMMSNDRLGLGTDMSAGKPIVAAVGFLIMFLVLVATAITGWIYRHNLVFVTSEKIAEITYVSIFNRKITQLDLSDIQDVAVEQKGIFPRVFGYGTLLVETAGEREDVMFTFAPLPYKCAKQIVGAREVRKGYGNIAPKYQQAQAQQMPPMPAPPQPVGQADPVPSDDISPPDTAN